MERHVDNALAVATWLEGRDDVASVRYSGLASSPYYERHRKYCPRGAGSILTFDLAGGREAGADRVRPRVLRAVRRPEPHPGRQPRLRDRECEGRELEFHVFDRRIRDRMERGRAGRP